jgi:hypothetical protein
MTDLILKAAQADRDLHLNYDGCYYKGIVDNEVVPCELRAGDDRMSAHSCYGDKVSEENIDFSWPELGMRNNAELKAAIYVTRRATSQYRRGPKPSNVDAYICDGRARATNTGSGRHAFEYHGAELYDPTYPDIKMANWLLQHRGWASVAINPDVALCNTGHIYYHRFLVGKIEGGEVIFEQDVVTPRIRRIIRGLVEVIYAEDV